MRLFLSTTGVTPGYEALMLKMEGNLKPEKRRELMQRYDRNAINLRTKKEVISCPECRIETDKNKFNQIINVYKHMCDACGTRIRTEKKDARAAAEERMTQEDIAERKRLKELRKQTEEANKRNAAREREEQVYLLVVKEEREGSHNIRLQASYKHKGNRNYLIKILHNGEVELEMGNMTPIKILNMKELFLKKYKKEMGYGKRKTQFIKDMIEDIGMRCETNQEFAELLEERLRHDIFKPGDQRPITKANIKPFQTLARDLPEYEALMLEKEKEYRGKCLERYLTDIIGVVYSIKTKEMMIHCNICENDMEINKFTLYRDYGDLVMAYRFNENPFCNACKAKYPRAKREVIAREKNKHILDYNTKNHGNEIGIEQEYALECSARKQKYIDALQAEDKKVRIANTIKRERQEKKDQYKLKKAENELWRFNHFMEHGEYPKPSGSDYDVLYLWKDTHRDNLYKIGITSKRSGTKRIYDVASKANMRAEIIHYVEVEDALTIEKQLLKYGEKVKFDIKTDGATEFRYLTEEELEFIGYDIEDYVAYSIA